MDIDEVGTCHITGRREDAPNRELTTTALKLISRRDSVFFVCMNVIDGLPSNIQLKYFTFFNHTLYSLLSLLRLHT
jgi:hypothetical protein